MSAVCFLFLRRDWVTVCSLLFCCWLVMFVVGSLLARRRVWCLFVVGVPVVCFGFDVGLLSVCCWCVVVLWMVVCWHVVGLLLLLC